MQTLSDIIHDAGAFKPSTYPRIYERLFEPIRTLPLTLLELGIQSGGSLKAWEAYFPYARIAGIDAAPPKISFGERVRMFAGDQADPAVLSRAAAEVAPDGFDIIIDDCAHIGRVAKASFWHLFDHHLKPGGLYCIEDWGTGYWPSWEDGRRVTPEPDTAERMPSHDAGMVGFIKQLVDEVGIGDNRESQNAPVPRCSRFSALTLHPGICIVRKAIAPGAGET